MSSDKLLTPEERRKLVEKPFPVVRIYGRKTSGGVKHWRFDVPLRGRHIGPLPGDEWPDGDAD